MCVCVCVRVRYAWACARDMEKRVNIRGEEWIFLSAIFFFAWSRRGGCCCPLSYSSSSSNFLPSFPFLDESCCWCYSWHFARFYQVRENGILSSLPLSVLHLHLRGPMLHLVRLLDHTLRYVTFLLLRMYGFLIELLPSSEYHGWTKRKTSYLVTIKITAK